MHLPLLIDNHVGHTKVKYGIIICIGTHCCFMHLLHLLIDMAIASGGDYSKNNNNTMTMDICLSICFVMKHKQFHVPFDPINITSVKFAGLTLDFVFKKKLEKVVGNTIE